MDINITKYDDFSVVELVGDVDLSCSPDARTQILKVLNNETDLAVNLEKVTYIDSSGIASLVEGYQIAKKKQLSFALVSASPAVMSVLTLARLDMVFPMFANLEEYKANQSALKNRR